MYPTTIHSYLHNAHDGCLNGDGAVFLHPLRVMALLQQGHGDADLAHGTPAWWVVDMV